MRRRAVPGTAAFLGFLILIIASSWACESPYAARPANEDEARPVSQGTPASAADARFGTGYVVWESSRSQMWRLWIRELAAGVGFASPARQLTADEDGRQHCCAHPSPDGSGIAYLSLPHGQQRYPESGAAGILRFVRPDGSAERVLAAVARTYSEHRAVVWRSPEELIFIDGEGRTRLLEVASGESRPLTEAPLPAHGYLIDPGLHHATTGVPTFSDYDPNRLAVRERPFLGGCQPYFSADGRWGYWIAGAGGPVNAMDLATRRVKTVLRKSDPRIPEGQGYVYFPMYSPDGRLFTFASSRDEHSHHQADYDVFLARSDPRTLEIVGPVVRVTEHPATDRFPAAWNEPLPPGQETALAEPMPPEIDEPRLEPGEEWPSSRRDLLFLWEHDGGDVEVIDPRDGVLRSSILTPRGRAFYGRDGEMVLDGGAIEAGGENMRAVFEGARATNELTLEAWVTPAAEVPATLGGPAWIVTQSSGDGARNFSLGQTGEKLVFRLRTSKAEAPQIELGELPAGEARHLVVSYTPGRLRAWLDGELLHESDVIKSGFFHWKPRAFLFGNESAGVERPWRGRIEGVAIYGRALDGDETAENHRRQRTRLDQRPAVETLRVRGRLAARSPLPSLDEISPYRDALAVFEYEVVEVVEGSYEGERLRIAHRVWVDGERQEVVKRRIGEVYELLAEPFADHPELAPLYVSDRQRAGSSGAGEPGAAARLFYDPPFP